MCPPNNAKLCLWQLTPRWMFVPWCRTRMQADKHNAVTASNNTNMNLVKITQEALTNDPVNDTGVISENLCCVKIHHSRATRSALPKVHVCTFRWCHVPSEKIFFYWSTKEKEAVTAEDSSCAWASGSTTSGWRVLEILLITVLVKFMWNKHVKLLKGVGDIIISLWIRFNHFSFLSFTFKYLNCSFLLYYYHYCYIM